MYSTCMVHAVAFWPLDDIAKPLRCANVRVLKHGQKHGHQQENRSGLWGKPKDGSRAQAANTAKSHHVQWTKVKRTKRIYTLGTMMHLMKYAP